MCDWALKLIFLASVVGGFVAAFVVAVVAAAIILGGGGGGGEGSDGDGGARVRDGSVAVGDKCFSFIVLAPFNGILNHILSTLQLKYKRKTRNNAMKSSSRDGRKAPPFMTFRLASIYYLKHNFKVLSMRVRGN